MFRELRDATRVIVPREMRQTIRKVYYYGSVFTCPICGSSVRKLFDAGFDFPILHKLNVIGGFRSEDVCPICFTHGRTRLIATYLKREVFKSGNKYRRILHMAPERSLVPLMQGIADVDYVAADLKAENFQEFVPVVKADITDLPWSKDTFDLIVCNHVLEHISNDRQAMAELFRVLRPGGLAILQVPLSAVLSVTIEDSSPMAGEERERRFGQSDHIRVYGADYIKRLERAGFHVTIFNPVVHWGPQEITRLRLDPEEKIFRGTKTQSESISF